MEYTYTQFVAALTGGEFDEVTFGVRDYGHYSRCRIICHHFDGGMHTEFLLTPDGKETVYYHGTFRDDKIFRLRGKKYTLCDVWKYVDISDIIYHNK